MARSRSARLPGGVLRRLAAALLALAGALAGAPAAAGSSGPAVPGEILVQLDNANALPALLARYPLTLVSRFGARPIFRLRTIGSADVGKTIGALSLEPRVLSAEPNYLHGSPEARKNVVWAVGEPGAYAAQWAPAALRLPAAQGVSLGAGSRVAVLDTGVDPRHPALAGRLLPGRDFVDGDLDASESGPGGAGWGHGTHVAGLIALAAPQARIMPLRVLDSTGTTNAWVLAEALLYALDPDGNPATDDGAHVINLSLGSAARTRLLGAIGQLASCAAFAPTAPAGVFADPGYNDDRQRCTGSAGALVVAAAGNEGGTAREYPAAEGVYGLLAVTASAADGTLPKFANRGGWIDFAAPGDRITSSVPGGGFGTWSGTSMAAPLVAGTAALLHAAEPALTPRDLQRRLQRSTAPLCGTKLRQLDAALALGLPAAAPRSCP